MSDKSFNMDELSALTGLSKRTVRYYIQLELLPRPVGEGRGARYTRDHLDRLLRIRKLTDAGVSLERVREVLAGSDCPVPPRNRRPGSVELRSRIYVAPGLEIEVAPTDGGLPPDRLQSFVQGVIRLAEAELAEGQPAEGESPEGQPAEGQSPEGQPPEGQPAAEPSGSGAKSAKAGRKGAGPAAAKLAKAALKELAEPAAPGGAPPVD
ncbi:MAG: MerR family transcriptional regulator [Deltaproteobacteria bacterium]|jgi:DNA-binding transcriptional MerR regulator|nr:MerR family transcriptional regulator [Deltaproteobacteria bacterium]